MKRGKYLTLFSIGLGLSLIIAAFSLDVYWWFGAMVLIGLLKQLFLPFPVALLADTKKEKLQAAMYGREIMMNVGRTLLGLISIGIFLALGELRVPLLISGVCTLAYAVLFEFSKKKKLNVE